MSQITVTGTIEYREMGTGAWALVADDGETYELRIPPDILQKSGQKVKVTGQVRDDMMSLAMIGKILEVESFELIH